MGNIQAKIVSSTTNKSNNKGNSEEILRAEVIGIVNDDDDDDDGGVSTSVGGVEEVEGLTIAAIAKDKGRGKLERKSLDKKSVSDNSTAVPTKEKRKALAVIKQHLTTNSKSSTRGLTTMKSTNRTSSKNMPILPPHHHEKENEMLATAAAIAESQIDLQSLYQTNEWTSLRKRGSQDMLHKTEMSYDELSEYISDGGSIVIPITPDDYLFQTKLQIERSLGMKDEISSMNIYHSGPSAVALNIHYDSYAVLVLQVTGKKMWMIQNGDFSDDDYKTNVSPESWKNVTMTEGDVLYIPKGVLHAATTFDGCDVSTHVTIGLV